MRCEKGESNPHGASPLAPKTSASTNSAILAKLDRNERGSVSDNRTLITPRRRNHQRRSSLGAERPRKRRKGEAVEVKEEAEARTAAPVKERRFRREWAHQDLNLEPAD